jgi:hypothetical protein
MPETPAAIYFAYWNHMIDMHDESEDDMVGLILDAARDHPTMHLHELIELVHNRQHTSEDWDAGHPEEELSP